MKKEADFLSVEVMKRRLIRGAYYLMILGAAFLGFKYLLGLILPFLLATVVAEVTRRPVDRISRRGKLSRRVVSFGVVTFALLILLVLAGCGVYGLYAAAQEAIEKLPELLESLQETVARLQSMAGVLGEKLPASLADAIHEAPASLIQTLTKELTAFLAGTAGRLPRAALTTVITVIASYLISADYYKLRNFLEQVVKPETMEKLRATRSVILGKLRYLFRGYGILMLITFGELTVGLFLLGVSKAPAVAAVTALVDILPIFGTGTVLIPWAAIALIRGRSTFAIGLLALYAVVSLLRNVIEPRVIGRQIELSPLIVLICLFAGYRLFGLGGLLLSPFIASILKELIKQDVL